MEIAMILLTLAVVILGVFSIRSRLILREEQDKCHEMTKDIYQLTSGLNNIKILRIPEHEADISHLKDLLEALEKSHWDLYASVTSLGDKVGYAHVKVETRWVKKQKS